MRRRLVAAVLLCGAVLASAQAIRPNPGFKANIVPRNDDGSSAPQPLGFTINFFGKTRSSVWVNNNGNLTFDSALATYTPFGLQSTHREIIAPFFADVDTRGPRSQVVTFGQDTANGHRAFGANYIDVGYYDSHDDLLNSFQVVVIDRSETGEGNFDIEFNYARINWETGDASNGRGGLGGVPAVVGWSNGTTEDGTSFELPGSMLSGSFLDGGPQALIRQRLNTTTVGRLLFRARDGVISPGLTINTGPNLPDGTIGLPYSLTLTAGGTSGPFRWSWTPDITPPPGLSLNSNGTVSGTPSATGTYTFTVGVTATVDDAEQTVYKRMAITIGAPKIAITTACPLPDGAVGQTYSATFEARGAAAGYRWTVDDPYSLPPGMNLSSGGRLAGTPLYPGTYAFNLHASSLAPDGSQPVQKMCRVTIAPASVQLASGCTLPDATVGVPYSQTLAPSGGAPPYTFRLAGQLPTGLALSADGRISGTATVASYFPFSLTIEDSQGAAQTYQCSVNVQPPGLAIGACPLPPAVTGKPYSVTLPASGGVSPLTWSIAGSLPSGLTLSPEGEISGTPLAAGPFLFRLLVADAQGRQAGQPCSISISRAPLAVSGCPLPDASVGQPYSTNLTPAGGIEPYLWTYSGSLPPGLSISTSGYVSGTPAKAGVFPITLKLMDGTMQAATQPCSLRVNDAALRIATSCPLPQGRMGQFYSTQFTAQGGAPPYRFDFYGYLPNGLGVSADGTVAGTPASLGAMDFLVQVTDSRGQTASNLCSIDVALPPPPSIRIADLPQTVAPASSLDITVQLAATYSMPIQGQLALSIAPDTASTDAGANQADPRVRFQNGQTVAAFTIPSGATRATVPLASTGTVASTVTVSVAKLRVAGADLPAVVTPVVFRIPPAPPSITSACWTPSDTTLDLAVTGFSNTRELLAAQVSLGSQKITTDLTQISAGYFSGPETVRFGGAFTIHIPYNLPFPVPQSVPVTLFNTVGSSGMVIAQQCR